MPSKKTFWLVVVFIFSISASYAQSFMVLEKMGTKKRYVYYVGETIEYQLKGDNSFDRNQITNILDSAFIVRQDTVPFNAVQRINIKSKRKAGIINSSGPILIIAGVGILAIDVINRGLVQSGGYTWDSSIGATAFIIAGTGALIMVLQKNKVSLDGWWRLRNVSIN